VPSVAFSLQHLARFVQKHYQPWRQGIAGGEAVTDPQFRTTFFAHRSFTMLGLSLLFLVIALIAGVLGLSGTEYIASHIAWIFFVVFIVLFVVSLVFGRRSPPI
jgi:uncharacterized membrane protein YtjA (UPF0391 family)